MTVYLVPVVNIVMEGLQLPILVMVRLIFRCHSETCGARSSGDVGQLMMTKDEGRRRRGGGRRSDGGRTKAR